MESNDPVNPQVTVTVSGFIKEKNESAVQPQAQPQTQESSEKLITGPEAAVVLAARANREKNNKSNFILWFKLYLLFRFSFINLFPSFCLFYNPLNYIIYISILASMHRKVPAPFYASIIFLLKIKM
ncbi:hypothetical protein ES708_23512 [subsurface metagenome]